MCVYGVCVLCPPRALLFCCHPTQRYNSTTVVSMSISYFLVQFRFSSFGVLLISLVDVSCACSVGWQQYLYQLFRPCVFLVQFTRGASCRVDFSLCYVALPLGCPMGPGKCGRTCFGSVGTAPALDGCNYIFIL